MTITRDTTDNTIVILVCDNCGARDTGSPDDVVRLAGRMGWQLHARIGLCSLGQLCPRCAPKDPA